MRNRTQMLASSLCLVLLIGFTGCSANQSQQTTEKPKTVRLAKNTGSMAALYTAEPVTVDGQLDEPIWQRAAAYPLQYSRDRASSGDRALEGGSVQLAWDNEFFYVAVDLTDSDVVAEGEEDELPHFKLGDVCELFLKPNDQTWYWELYATPLGLKSSFWFPGRGRFGLPSNFEYSTGLVVDAKTKGTLNNWRDRDTGWSAEMAIPIKDLTIGGQPFAPNAGWTILVARYNYSRYHPFRGPELTMTPALPATNFHLLEHYAKLELVR